MAQAKTGKTKKVPADKRAAERGLLVMGRRNLLLLLAGIGVIVVGYILLGRGSITAAPLLLVLGYCGMVPLSIILWVRKPESKSDSGRSGTGE